MSDRPLSDHPFCQQEQEPDQIDMMSVEQLSDELRTALVSIERLTAENEKLKRVYEAASQPLMNQDDDEGISYYDFFDCLYEALADCEKEK